VQEEVNQLREAARGLVGRIADAIAAFIDDPIRAIINGLLSLVGISPAAFWALIDKISAVIDMIADDPMTFVDNLLSAVRRGFELFFDNIWTHLIRGLLEWLFSSMPAGSITVPTEFSLQSVITFILQIMGITWPRIRRILVQHIGEENVALIEQAWSLISTLIEKGPEGVFDMIRERLDPQEILNQVLQAAIEYVVETVIRNVALRIVALFNPAGAIVQAIELIYKLCKWIFENAARIFTFVETIVNGVADLLAGNIDGMARAIENALARLIPPVIDFLAELIGLGDLPDKVADIIKRLQAWVESIIDRIIGWLAARGRQLLAALGLGGEEQAAGAEGDLGEVGETITFSGGGESHRLWIRESGTTTTVMVATTEESVGQKLARWEVEASNLGEKQGDARRLISQAVLLSETEPRSLREAR
jgi:phage-related protein